MNNLSKSLSLVALLSLLTASCDDNKSIWVSDDFEEGFFSSGDLQMSYRIDFPLTEEPVPALVFSHGSGQKTKDAYNRWAKRLVDHGYAVMQFDKRGVGDSEGVHVPSNTSDVNAFILILSDDLAAGAEFLARHPRIDATRLGLLGESQAGWVIPPAATKAPSVDFVVVLSGPTVSLGQVSVFERDAHATDEPDLEAIAADVSTIVDGFDPSGWLQQMEVPGLWVFGSQDRNVPVTNCVRFLESLVQNNGKPFDTIVYPEGDHGLRVAGTREGIPFLNDVLEWLDATEDY